MLDLNVLGGYNFHQIVANKYPCDLIDCFRCIQIDHMHDKIT